MKITCLIVEDEPLARNLLVDYISKVPFLQLVKACSNPLEAIDLLEGKKIDLLFLDVQMPEITGLTLLKVLSNKPLIILTTAYSEYALEGYEYDVLDYLLKPITLERFLKAVDKASNRISTMISAHESLNQPAPIKGYIFVKDGTHLVKVHWDDILYIEGLKDYVIIHTNQKKIISLQRLKSLEDSLPADHFFRIHNSYIVSLKKIDTIHKDKIHIGEASLPIGDTYKKKFRALIDKNHLI